MKPRDRVSVKLAVSHSMTRTIGYAHFRCGVGPSEIGSDRFNLVWSIRLWASLVSRSALSGLPPLPWLPPSYWPVVPPDERRHSLDRLDREPPSGGSFLSIARVRVSRWRSELLDRVPEIGAPAMDWFSVALLALAALLAVFLHFVALGLL